METTIYRTNLSTTSKFTSEAFDTLTDLAQLFTTYISNKRLSNWQIEEEYSISELYSEWENDKEEFNNENDVKQTIENFLENLKECFREEAQEIVKRNNEEINGEGALKDTLRTEFDIDDYTKFDSMILETWDYEGAKELVDKIKELDIQNRNIEGLMNIELEF